MTLEKGLVLGVTLLLAVVMASVLGSARPLHGAVPSAHVAEGEIVPPPPREEPLTGPRPAPRLEPGPVDPEKGKAFGFLPPPDPGVRPAPTPGPDEPVGRRHTVASGDRLVDLAKRYLGREGAYLDIVKANPGLDPKRMRLGQVLLIPEKGAQATGPATSATSAPPKRTTQTAEGRWHTVKSGEILGRIAHQYYGNSGAWTKIQDDRGRPLRNPHSLQVGQRLRIP